MLIRKPINWFLTEQGKKFSLTVITGTGFTLGAVNFLPNTFMLQKYKDWVLYFRKSESIELPKELHHRYQKCLELLEISEYHKKIIKPFSTYGLDLFHAGSLSFRFGAVVVIPHSFTYKSLDDVKKYKLEVSDKPVDLTTGIGMVLGKSLILSEKAQEFAICREILMTNTNKIILESCYPILSVIFVHQLSKFLNTRFNFYSATAATRAILYFLVSIFGLSLHFLIKDATQVTYEIEVDQRLAELGLDYVKGGIEFYDKLLERNRALREVMGKEGESKYKEDGNENYGVRQLHMDLTHRKKYFEEILALGVDSKK